MILRRAVCLLAFGLCLVAPGARSDTTEQDQPSAFSGYHFDDPKQLERELERDYGDRVLTLRYFDRRGAIEVGSDGEISGDIEPGPWTMYGKIKVSYMRVNHDRIDFWARRLWMQWDESKKEFRHLDTPYWVRIGFWQPSQGLDGAWLENAFLKVFLSSEEELADVVPPWWQPFLRNEFEAPEKEKKEEPGLSSEEVGRSESSIHPPIYRIGGEVSAPLCLYCPDPKYPPAVRSAKIQGSVVLWCIVNKEGRIANVRIARPFGVGLEDAAVQTVQRWKLEPARRDGEPVAVYMTIEVNFTLY